jgi:hypothetical protein
MNYNLFKVGIQGPSSNTTLVGYFPFFLFGAFGKKSFSSNTILAEGNPSFGQQNLA